MVTAESRAGKWSSALSWLGLAGVIAGRVWALEWLLYLGLVLFVASVAVPLWRGWRTKSR
ncbi:MAG: hypothetical protein IPJ15_10510 [Actinomycetales bacterium]|nr:hypothetical protein [Candidatus Phosphoribacter baldrii]